MDHSPTTEAIQGAPRSCNTLATESIRAKEHAKTITYGKQDASAKVICVNRTKENIESLLVPNNFVSYHSELDRISDLLRRERLN